MAVDQVAKESQDIRRTERSERRKEEEARIEAKEQEQAQASRPLEKRGSQVDIDA